MFCKSNTNPHKKGNKGILNNMKEIFSRIWSIKKVKLLSLPPVFET